MIDLYNLTKTNDTQFFFNQGNDVWQTWSKPRGCKLIYVATIGGGGGGGGGRSGSNTPRTGGGGGGSSQGLFGFIPATSLPDVLYVNVGQGGVGGLSNTNGSGGTPSYVSTLPSPNGVNVVSMSYGGGGAAGVAGGVVGSGTIQNFLGSGIYTAAAALGFNGIFTAPSIAVIGGGSTTTSGAAGGTNTGGNGNQVIPTHLVSGGAGGGGSSSTNTDGVGGQINNGRNNYSNIIGGLSGGTNTLEIIGSSTITSDISRLIIGRSRVTRLGNKFVCTDSIVVNSSHPYALYGKLKNVLCSTGHYQFSQYTDKIYRFVFVDNIKYLVFNANLLFMFKAE